MRFTTFTTFLVRGSIIGNGLHSGGGFFLLLFRVVVFVIVLLLLLLLTGTASLLLLGVVDRCGGYSGIRFRLEPEPGLDGV